MRRALPAALVAVAMLSMATPAAASGSTTTTSSSSSTSTSSTTTVPAGQPVPIDPNNLTQQLSEVPPAEAQLIGLLQGVRSRLASLQDQLQTLNQDLVTNQQALDKANQDLARSQAEVTAADTRVTQIAFDMSVAQDEMQQRAVAAYIRQPSGELANLLLHARDPADLTDIKTFYDALVSAQMKTVARFDQLQRAAKAAARAAINARDIAKRTQQAVSEQQIILKSLRSSFELVQQESADQESQQTALLSQANQDKAAFEAAVQQQAQLSAQITQLLQQLAQSSSESGGPAIPASSGFFAVPIPGARITSPFGPRVDPILNTIGFHPGVDFGANLGTPIYAAGDGFVVWAGPDGGYGNCTIIDHGHSMATLYAHQSQILVKVGDQVTRGQLIGQVGTTGWSTGPHLHFEVRVNGTPVDPVPYL